MNNKRLTYVSLFSSAGVGCFGFKVNGFDCIVTSELIEKRLNIQKYNKKCKHSSGYICGDITDEYIKQNILNEIRLYKQEEGINDIDVIIATPPCQGMSVANHKKTHDEINRNSLVVEAIIMIKLIQPRVFIFENVQAFMNAACFDHGTKKKISDAISENLSKDYEYYSDVLNFKKYGANSSRTRTLVIGVRKDLLDIMNPIELFPAVQSEKVLKELIYDLPRLNNIGQICEVDIYHSFKKYASHMRAWLSDLGEGQSAYDNNELIKQPHQMINGQIVINVNKNGDKYKRQVWNKVAPCIHTRNDILASQNTIHPEDDRVFSIRELMIMMNIPAEFKWVEENEEYLNKLSLEEKMSFLKKNEINIRQSIGEAIPTVIIEQIASNIRAKLNENKLDDKKLKKLILDLELSNIEKLYNFVKDNYELYPTNTLSRIVELANSQQVKTAAYYTDQDTLNRIYVNLPEINKEEIRILEPSVGVGNFIPFIVRKYGNAKKLIIDVFDINHDSIQILKIFIKKMRLPCHVIINYFNHDFVTYNFQQKYDLVIGNPPFIKLKKSTTLKSYRSIINDNLANNSSAFFLEKAYKISNYVVMILPKYFLHNNDFKNCRGLTSQYAIEKIIDFGEKGFKGILIETICIFVNTLDKFGKTMCVSITRGITNIMCQQNICDPYFPNWLLYRDNFFDNICIKMKFGIFTCYRDRQITNKYLRIKGDVRVLKSKNIPINGSGITYIQGYDSYIDVKDISKLAIAKYHDRNDVFLSPNMTYYPRVVRKPKNTLVNGSVAVFELKNGEDINDDDLRYFASKEFWKFYSIARNLSTRSLNLDNNSVFYFGKKVY